MTLDEAIRIKSLEGEEFLLLTLNDIDEADRLSIEALKAIKEWRHYPFPDGVIRLPGETDE